MMAELSPVPFGRCRGRWRDHQLRTVPSRRERRRRLFPFRACLELRKMEVATWWFRSPPIVHFLHKSFPDLTQRFLSVAMSEYTPKTIPNSHRHAQDTFYDM